jgi:hypothetical protein
MAAGGQATSGIPGGGRSGPAVRGRLRLARLAALAFAASVTGAACGPGSELPAGDARETGADDDAAAHDEDGASTDADAAEHDGNEGFEAADEAGPPPADDGGADAPETTDAADAHDTPDVPDGPDPCAPIAGASYRSLSTVGPTTDRPPPEHADLNLHLRGWEPTGGTLGLIDLSGPTDDLAPKIYSMFGDDRVPVFVRNYQVYDWNWETNSRAGLITDWEVTLAGLGTAPGEVLEVPDSGYDIGEGLDVRVLHVDDDSITLKYTREDNVVSGYTIHVVGVCVEPGLRGLYEADDAAGRGELPALGGNQPFGRARSAEVLVAVRDTGAFMDPRSRKDWW